MAELSAGHDAPRVDVVVPCYNYGRYLRHCVQSVLDQRGVAARVLVIDDASTDDSSIVGAMLAASDSRVEFRRHAVNKGHIATYNEGIDWAQGDYFLLLSADDYLLPDALFRSTQLMNSHVDVSFTFGRALSTENDDGASQIPAHTTASPCWVIPGTDFIRTSAAHNLVPTPTAVVRMSAQKRVGGYSADLPHAGDMEMWLRLAAGGDVGFVDGYLAVYRRHPANMSLTYYLDGSLPDLCQRRTAIESFLKRPGLQQPMRLRRMLLRSLATVAVQNASAALNDGQCELAHRLTQFALDSDPGVTRSWPWAKLAMKRRLPLAWRVVRPMVQRLRHLRASARPSLSG